MHKGSKLTWNTTIRVDVGVLRLLEGGVGYYFELVRYIELLENDDELSVLSM